MLESVIAGDADPGDHLRRRRREVALDNNITGNLPVVLDAQPTITLRFEINFAQVMFQ
jgi:hypothetical protein